MAINLYRWWLLKQIKSIPIINGETLTLWIQLLTRLAARKIEIDPKLRLVIPYERVGEHYNELSKLNKVFSYPAIINLPKPTEVWLEDWLVNPDNYRVPIATVLTEYATLLTHINASFSSTEDCDFASSIMSQYEELFSTVVLIATVTSRHVVG